MNTRRPCPWYLLLLCAWMGAATCLGLDWRPGDQGRIARLTVVPTDKTGFALLDAAAHGIRFTNHVAIADAKINNNLLNGAGLAAGDFDGDGWCDLYFCNLGGTNALYRNLGNWRFEDVTLSSGTACPGQASTGAVFADLDGDGRLDLLVSSCGGPVTCFLNLGNGRFANATAASGLAAGDGTTSMALADVDGNGTLDLYVAAYARMSLLRSGGAIATRTVNGRTVATGPGSERIRIINGRMVELGEPDTLYLNDGKAHFTPVSWTNGAFLNEAGQPLREPPRDLGLSAIFRDIDGDGAPDIYVCNDFDGPDRIWMNDGKGRFRALPRLAMRSGSRFSMNADFADIDRDGFDDFMVADMPSRFHVLRTTQMGAMDGAQRQPGRFLDRPQIRRNTLFLNRGDGSYAEIANHAGVAASDWTWCLAFMDVDLDGYEDLLVATGHAYDIQDFDATEKMERLGRPRSAADARDRLLLFPPLRTPNYIFRNQGDLTFAETGTKWGFDSLQVTHGMVLADLDNDGDLDVVANCLEGPPLLYRNESDRPRVAVRLKGKAPNTKGIGARVRMTGFGLPQTQQLLAGGRYLSADEPLRVFAAGAPTNKLAVEVTWRSGLRTLVREVPADSVLEIDEAGAVAAPQAPVEVARPLFADASALINHRHAENAFDEFRRQPLLPKMLSQSGPGISWHDWDGDGHDDLIIGSGMGGTLSIYRNRGDGTFAAVGDAAYTPKAAADQTGVVGWTPAPGRNGLLVGLSSYEDGTTNVPAALNLQWAPGLAPETTMIPGTASSTGPVAVADVDGDGDLDVFVGGRVVPGRYPEASSSRLFRNHGGQLVEESADRRIFAGVGLVSGAVFGDLDNDGYPELILACEWGPIRVYRNERGQFREVTGELGFERFTGWWNGVATGDLDGDGKPDIVASNWGLNGMYEASESKPLQLFHGDFDRDEFVDLLEAEYEEDKVYPRRDLYVLGAVFPGLRDIYATHRAFGEATLGQITKAMHWETKAVRATTLASMAFLNRGSTFQPSLLPREAQFAPAFAVCVADFDGDGRQDVFLGQNLFALAPDTPRLDAGRGLLLRGNGRGGFDALSAGQSGLEIHGEQRGAAFADYDGDGRMDLAVTQNGGQTYLYHNQGAIPGLRVRLKGSPGNPTGIGAQIRPGNGAVLGPVVEVQAGSGYWSQNSAVAILPAVVPGSHVEVRWPGGRVTRTSVPAGAKTVDIAIGQ